MTNNIHTTEIFELTKKLKEKLSEVEAKSSASFLFKYNKFVDSLGLDFNIPSYDKIVPYDYLSNELNGYNHKLVGGILTIGGIVSATGLAYMHLSGRVKSTDSIAPTALDDSVSLQIVNSLGQSAIDLIQEEASKAISPAKLTEAAIVASIEVTAEKAIEGINQLSQPYNDNHEYASLSSSSQTIKEVNVASSPTNIATSFSPDNSFHIEVEQPLSPRENLHTKYSQSAQLKIINPSPSLSFQSVMNLEKDMAASIQESARDTLPSDIAAKNPLQPTCSLSQHEIDETFYDVDLSDGIIEEDEAYELNGYDLLSHDR